MMCLSYMMVLHYVVVTVSCCSLERGKLTSTHFNKLIPRCSYSDVGTQDLKLVITVCLLDREFCSLQNKF